jgi:hypothetical protein
MFFFSKKQKEVAQVPPAKTQEPICLSEIKTDDYIQISGGTYPTIPSNQTL